MTKREPGAGDPKMQRDGRIYPHWTVREGMSGWFAVLMWWNPDMDGFPEPWTTADGRYPEESTAIEEGRDLARLDEVPFYRRGFA